MIKSNERASAVSRHVAVAKNSSKDARARAVSVEAKTKTTQTEAQTVGGKIDAALASLEANDYTSTAQHLIAAKVGNAVVMSYLQQTLDDLMAMRSNFDTVATELNSAEEEIQKLKADNAQLQAAIDKMATDGGEDHVIAKRCKSFFGLGAIFYGIERLLKAGIVGILIFVGLLLVIVAASYFIGGPVGGLVLGTVSKLWRWKKKPNE